MNTTNWRELSVMSFTVAIAIRVDICSTRERTNVEGFSLEILTSYSYVKTIIRNTACMHVAHAVILADMQFLQELLYLHGYCPFIASPYNPPRKETYHFEIYIRDYAMLSLHIPHFMTGLYTLWLGHYERKRCILDGALRWKKLDLERHTSWRLETYCIYIPLRGI